MTSDDEYWSIDIPGLTYEQATRLREAWLKDAQWGVILLDPRKTMVRGFDRPAVQVLIKCLDAGLATGTLGHLDAAGAQSLREDFELWLEQAAE